MHPNFLQFFAAMQHAQSLPTFLTKMVEKVAQWFLNMLVKINLSAQGVILSSFYLKAWSNAGRFFRCSDWLAARCLFYLLLAYSTAVQAQTPISGVISTDSRWTLANSPYVLSGNVVLQNGASLSIDAGVTIYMARNASFSVQAGSVQALGKSNQLIQVLSEQTRLGQAAAAGDWQQWQFGPGTENTRLEYVLFEHGNGLLVQGSAPALSYLTLRNHAGAAITLDLAAAPSGVGLLASGNRINGIVLPAGEVRGNLSLQLLGIPYVIEEGVLAIGAAPVIQSLTPNVVQQGERQVLTLTGSRLRGLTQAQFDKAGLQLEILPDSTDTQANLAVTVAANAPLGASTLTLLVDAGQAQLANVLQVERPQPVLEQITPSVLYLGQGLQELQIKGRRFNAQASVLLNGTPLETQYLSDSQLRVNVNTPGVPGNLRLAVQIPDPSQSGQFLRSNEMILPVAAGQLQINPSRATIFKGSSKTFTVNLPYAAPTGGINLNLVSSVPGVASVPALLTVAAGQSSANFQLNSLANGDSTITASHLNFHSAQAQVSVIAPPSLSLTPSVLNLGVGREAELTLSASQVAPEGGLQVNLQNSDSSVVSAPSEVVIAAGSKTSTLRVTTIKAGNATIQAQATDFVSASATVTVRPLALSLPNAILVAPGVTRSIPLNLSDPAPAGGLVVTLASDNPALATVPDSITVPEGKTSANFIVTGVRAGNANINASANGYQAASMPLTIETVLIGTGIPAMNTLSVPVDVTSAPFAITISRPAPPGGLLIDLTLADPSIASVSPAQVAIPEGQTSSGAVRVTLTGIKRGETSLLASSAGLSSGNLPITVTGKPELVWAWGTATVAKGFKTYQYELTIYRQTDGAYYSPNQAETVTLTSSDPAKLQVPANVTIPAGQAGVGLTITGLDVSDGAPVMVDASASNYAPMRNKLAVNVIAPVLNMPSIELSRSTFGERNYLYVSAYVPGARYPYHQTAALDIPIDLSVVEAAPAGIVDGFYEAATGSTPMPRLTISKDTVNSNGSYLAVPSTVGSYKVKASAVGYAEFVSNQVSVTQPQLRFMMADLIVGKGMKTPINGAGVMLTYNNDVVYASTPITVRLHNSDASKVGLPETVTIPVGAYHAYFAVSGLETSNGNPVLLDASVDGVAPPPNKIAINVVTPQLNIGGLEQVRSPSSVRNAVSAYLTVPGVSNWYYPQTMIADTMVDFAIVDANPAGIVDGIYSDPNSATTMTQLKINKDSYSSSNNVWLGVPGAAGSYKLRASIAGLTSITSEPVQVIAPELKFSTTNVIVGKGFNTYYWEAQVMRSLNGSPTYTGQLTVNLSSSDPGKISIPASVTIQDGQDRAYFTITGQQLSDATPVMIDANASGYLPVVEKMAVNVVPAQFNFAGLELNRSPVNARNGVYVSATIPGSPYANYQTPASDIPISLGIVEANPANIIDGIYSDSVAGNAITQVVMPRGQRSSSYFYLATPSAEGSYKLQASSPDVFTTTSAAVTVTAPELRFSRSGLTVAKSMATHPYEAYVMRVLNDVAIISNQAQTIRLISSDPSKVNVPAEVTIPAGEAYAYFTVSGVDVTGDTAILVDAVAPGHKATSNKFAVKVDLPTLNINGVETNRSTASARDSVGFTLTSYSDNYWYVRTAASDLVVDLSLIETTPAAIDAGFFSAPTEGNAITQLIIPKNSNGSSAAYIGRPPVTGSYKVRGEIADLGAVTSAQVNVNLPELRFAYSSANLGKGMRSASNLYHVYRSVNNAGVGGPAVTLQLTCRASTVCRVPASVTIPEGQDYVYFSIEGLDVGSTTIVASADGYNAGPEMAVNVVLPQLNLNVPGNTNVGGIPWFSIYLTVPGYDNSYYYPLQVVRDINLNLTSSAPAVATVPASVTITAGGYSTGAQMNAIAVGSTTITASGNDLQSVTSGQITVNP